MKFRIALALLIIASLTRLLPHPPNFTPIAAIGLFGAAYFERRWLALAVPFGALFFTDLFINNVVYSSLYTGFAWITSWWIYVAFTLVLVIGWVTLRGNVSAGRVVTASLASSVAFFLISNASTWMETPLYPKTAAGLLSCYIAGLPFFGNTLAGDLCYSGVLFGAYAWAIRGIPALSKG